MNEDQRRRVAPLGELDDYKVADGDPDIRGWDVTTQDGRKVGEVDELLVDTEAMRVRYIAVDLNDDLAGDDRSVLVPIGAAHLDDEADRVLVVGISREQFTTLPEYRREAFDRDYESSVLSSFQGSDRDVDRSRESRQPADTAPDARHDEDYYANRQFDDSGFFRQKRGAREARVVRSEEELEIGKRQVRAGEVEVRKTVETEHVREPVTRMREEVTVERHPVEGRTVGETEIGEDEIRVPVVEEEVVVEKRPVAKEEVVLRTREVEDTEQVEADLRRERIDVDERGRTREPGRASSRDIDPRADEADTR